MPHARKLGADAEDRAARFLIGKGYVIVTRRFKARHGEIDLVALDGDTLVFVEVKSRSRGPLMPEESLTESKIAHLFRAAEEYLAKVDRTGSALRYDVVAIDSNGIRHYTNTLQQ